MAVVLDRLLNRHWGQTRRLVARRGGQAMGKFTTITRPPGFAVELGAVEGRQVLHSVATDRAVRPGRVLRWASRTLQSARGRGMMLLCGSNFTLWSPLQSTAWPPSRLGRCLRLFAVRLLLVINVDSLQRRNLSGVRGRADPREHHENGAHDPECSSPRNSWRVLSAMRVRK
jgi:hypothetical protein